SPDLIDLGPWYNFGLTEGIYGSMSGGLSGLAPLGVKKLATGTEFDVRGRIVVINQGMLGTGFEFPEAGPGIKVSRKCRRLHFLHSTFAWREVEGTVVGKFVLHLANSETRTMELKLGDDLWHYTF